jgi:hypothetical protein
LRRRLLRHRVLQRGVLGCRLLRHRVLQRGVLGCRLLRRRFLQHYGLESVQ